MMNVLILDGLLQTLRKKLERLINLPKYIVEIGHTE